MKHNIITLMLACSLSTAAHAKEVCRVVTLDLQWMPPTAAIHDTFVRQIVCADRRGHKALSH